MSLDQICNTLTQGSTIWIFVSIIVVVALIPTYQAIIGIRRVNNDLKKASNILKQLGKDNPFEKFYSQFETIKEQITGIKNLTHVWEGFVDSVFYDTISHDKNLKTKKIYLSHRPAYYFNRDSVLGARLNLPQFLAYPNYLIGLGLAFTFIGLAAALHVAQAGLTHGAGQKALQDLLAVASVKFISSIFGIVSSLLVSVLQKKRIKAFQVTLNKFCRLLEQYTEYKPAEKLLFESYQQQQEHTIALNSMANNIAEGIGNVLSNQLPASVANALEPLANEIRALAQKFSGSNENALENVLQEFLAQLRKSSGDEMQGLVESMTTLKSSLDILVGNMKVIGESFGSKTMDSSDRLISMLESFVTTFAPVQQGIGKFGESLASLEHIAGSIQQASGSISGAADVSHQSMSNLAGTVNDISTNLAPMQELLASLNQSLRKVDESSEKLSTAGNTIGFAADGFKRSAESIDSAGNRFDQKMKTFEVVIDGISGTAAVLDRASGHMNNAIQPLTETSVGFTKVFQAIQETETRIQGSQQHLNTMLVDLQKFTESIPALWQQYEGRFNKVDEDLGQAFGQLAKGSEEFQVSVKEFVTSLDGSFSNALNRLSGAVKELQEERENAQSAIHSQENMEYVDADTRIA